MKTYTYKDYPVKIFGLAEFDKNQRLTRLPDEIIEQVPSLSHYGRRCPGARLCFRTDSRRFTVRILFKTLSVDVGMSIYNCQSAFVFAGEKSTCRYLDIVHPNGYENKDFSTVIDKGNDEMEDIIVWLPRNEILENIEISIDGNAEITEPTPYKSMEMVRLMVRLLGVRLALGKGVVPVSKRVKVTTLSSWLLAVRMASL